MEHDSVSAVVVPALYPASSPDAARRRGPGFLGALEPLFAVPSSLKERIDGFAIEQEHVWITGFTVYVVEQWIVDRTRTLSTIVVYTGSENDKLAVDVLVPNAELGDVQQATSIALRHLRVDGARPKETQHGIIHVTTLPSFRSDLNIVQVPGSVAEYREHIYANIALRRLGCGMRTTLSIQAPNPSQCEKLFGTFHVHPVTGEAEVIRLVLSLVQLVQHGLSLFALGPFGEGMTSQNPICEEGDGLLCDETVKAINRFSSEAGERFCKTEPSESGGLGRSALAILLTSIISLRSRLSALGSGHVPSDPFASRRRFLQAYRTHCTSLGISDRALTVDTLLTIRRNMADHSEGFIKARLKSTFEEVSRLTDVTGERRNMNEEETGDLLLFANGLKRANWAVGVTTVQLLWTGKSKATSGAGLRIPGMRRAKPSSGNVLVSNDTDVTDSEADPDVQPKSTTQAIFRAPTLIAKAAGRAVGVGQNNSLNASSSNLAAMRHSGSLHVGDMHKGRSEIYLGAPLHPGAASKSPSPFGSFVNLGSAVNLDESLHHQGPASSLPPPLAATKGRLRGIFSGGTRHFPAVEAAEEVLLGHSATGLVPPARPAWMMKRSASAQDAAREGATDEALAPALPRRRRHSYSHASDLLSQTVVLSQRRLRLDVELCAAYFDLRAYEAHMAALCAALRDIDATYAESAALLDVPLARRKEEIKDLEDRADLADQRLDNVVKEAPKPEEISKNEYHTQLFLSAVNELEVLRDELDVAVGSEGSLTKLWQKRRPVGDSWTRMIDALQARWRAGLDTIFGRPHND